MARTGLVQDLRFRDHETDPDHPERPERLTAIASRLDVDGLTRACVAVEPAAIDLALVERVHEVAYLRRLEEACRSHAPFIDVPDSSICPDSFETAQLAAGSVLEAVNSVMAGALDNAFCAVRPPGHHAEKHMSMGFCLFNNIAVAASHLLEHHGLNRVLIVDWDVHHGNGTQHAFEADPRVLFISLHGHPGILFPGTGYEHEHGVGDGAGFTINVPMLPPSSDAEWQRAFEHTVLPQAEKFAPEFVLISAGFDAHRRDPLAPLELETPVFGWMTNRLLEVARAHASGRLVSLLEGGYDFQSLAEASSLHVSQLLEG